MDAGHLMFGNWSQGTEGEAGAISDGACGQAEGWPLDGCPGEEDQGALL